MLGIRLDELSFKTILLLVSPRPGFPLAAACWNACPGLAAGFAGMLAAA